jgi:hypothetical protein
VVVEAASTAVAAAVVVHTVAADIADKADIANK